MKQMWLTPAGQDVLAEAKRVLSEKRLAAALRQLSLRQRRVLIGSLHEAVGSAVRTTAQWP